MKKTMVLYPGLSVSHFLPMMKLADELVEHGYAVTVALIDPALHRQIAFTATVDRVISSKPSICFHRLPRVEHPPATTTNDGDFFLPGYLDLVRRHNEPLHGFLCSMFPGGIHALVVDMLSVEALDIAERLKVPGYVFQPANASVVSFFLQIPSICAEGHRSFRELGDTPLELPGLPPMPASHLLDDLLEDPPESEVYKAVMESVRRYTNKYSNGFLVNTFESLEARVVNTLRDARRHGGPALPPFYCVGPLVNKAGERGERPERHECLTWLDRQPERSVVFLCFGSTGTGNHSAEQLKEIAAGLEKSGHRFLWVVRAPIVSDDPDRPYDPRAEPDLDALLPAGFLQRTSGHGAVVKLWAPQVDVLHHRATGAFVTHCGWNSVLEGITAGVPMLCWPLYAEQKMNKVLMVEEMRVAVEMVGWQQGLVTAEEVEAKVRLLMESEAGVELRARVTAQKEAAAVAWTDGGSSRAAFTEFLSDADSRRQLAVTS